MIQSISTRWTRALMGALLSALLISITLLLFNLNQSMSAGPTFYLYVALDLPGIFLHTWLLGDPFARLLPPEEASVLSKRIFWLTLLAWSWLGFGLAYFIKGNQTAIMAWLSVVLILTVVAIILP